MRSPFSILQQQRMKLVCFMILTQLVVLPFASPFANAGPQASSHRTPIDQSNRQKGVFQATSGTHTNEVPSRKKHNRLYRFFSNSRPTQSSSADETSSLSSSSNSRDWTIGESKASLLSRCFFSYANPLLKQASSRRLDQYDAFERSDDAKMGSIVSRFNDLYERTKTSTIQKLQREGKDSSSTDAQMLILAKSLLIFERRKLLQTACLRVFNTAVQAFPAILVSRLLRLVEAGTSQPPQSALVVVATLISVLTLKTVVENAYFDRVVRTSTQVRGILAGMIFDKSLRLSGTGATATSGATNDDDENITASGNVTATGSIGIGEVMNLMQSDASLIESFVTQIHTTWDGPLQIAVYTSLLYRYLGPSVIWGIAVLLVSIPVNSIGLRILNRLTRNEIAAKDARTKRTAESISNIKLLKLQGWTGRFVEDIRSNRNEELRRMVKRGIVKAVLTAYSSGVPSLVLVATLMAYTRQSTTLVASTIFTAISLFNQLRYPLFFFPMYIDSAANGKQALRRIANYLSSEESTPYTTELPPISGSSGKQSGGSIRLTNGNFLWPNGAPALVNAEFTAEPGEIVAVVGSVGSGKSAFIKSLLGELKPAPSLVFRKTLTDDEISGSMDKDFSSTDSPHVVSHGAVAYCSQEAWLPKGTIKDAIVFGRGFDEARYNAAIHDSGLDRDLGGAVNGFHSGHDAVSSGLLTHDTDVGEGGSSLSGGQRARVALARALYSDEDTKVFLIDDCLAALDATVGSIVFERLAARVRRSNAVAVFVTNDPSLPRQCDRVLLMGKVPSLSSCAKVVDIGKYDELLSRGHKLQTSSLIEVEPSTEETGVETTDSVLAAEGDIAFVQDGEEQLAITEQTISVSRHRECYPANGTEGYHADPECYQIMANCPEYLNEEFFPARSERANGASETHVSYDSNTTSQLIFSEQATDAERLSFQPAALKKLTSTDETMFAGAVPLSTYLSYLRAVRRPMLVVAMLASFLLSNGASFFQQYTVAKWTEIPNLNSALSFTYMQKLVKAAWAVSGFLFLRSFLTMQLGVRASEYLHSRMLTSVFAAPTSFFDATPSGQILSRFGKEVETIDRGVPESIGSVLFCFLNIFMSIGALAGVVTPGMLVPLSVAAFFYWKAMSLYRPAARDLKRAETKTRSPIYTHFGEALKGKEIIRSIPNARQRWASDHRRLSDSNLSVFGTVKILDRWLSTRLETLGNSVVLTASIAAVLLTRAGRLKAGLAGWGLTQSLAITGLMTWAVKVLTDMEANFLSVMRVKELSNVDSEQGRDLGVPMPRELSTPGEALAFLIHTNSTITRFAPLDSGALVTSGWPWRGHVSFSNVSMRYNEFSELVLRGVSLDIPAGTTLGVVGRTGSGKSSLLLTLFRLVEIESGGTILIDGVDIRSIGLQELRQSLAIIPQDPVLFAGSVAYNLDATGSCSAADMWSALETASPSLAVQFRSLHGLDSQVSEGGKNLSSGQRQLICLARALLRKSRILVLDEATSSVDSKTDQEVQNTIRREFVKKGVTVITVAHRLDTVLGYDKIAVLGDGKVLEYGAPTRLLSKSSGELRRLVDADRKNKRKGVASEKEKTVPS